MKPANRIPIAALVVAGASALAAFAAPASSTASVPGPDWAVLPLSEGYADGLLAGFGPAKGPCATTANVVARGAVRGAQADLAVAVGNCLNLADPEEAEECLEEAGEEFLEAIEEVLAQHEARLDLCALLGEGPYDPEIDPEDFVDAIDHPFFPHEVGVTRLYHAMTEDGLEIVEVTTTDETIEILGVECTVVRDTVSLLEEDGQEAELVEDTRDYFAQDEAGNVWYFGEISVEYEDGQIAGVEGSWMAGEDGGKPGILMHATPTVGLTFRQEFLLGEAEDAGTYLALDASAAVPYGSFDGCVQTADFTPLEPDVEEHKFYAEGVGLVLEVDLESGERVELIDVYAAE